MFCGSVIWFVFFFCEDSGEAEDVGGLDEEAADDGGSERTLRDPRTRP